MANVQNEDKDFRHIVRIVNTDLDGSKPIANALRKIKGIGFMYSNMIITFAGIPKNKKCGTLSDAEIRQLDEIIRNAEKYGAPTWMFNRRRDLETNQDMHLLTADLDFVRSNDIKLLKKMKCYRGVRHSIGQPVRGQKTRSNFRRNKGKKGGTLGVVRNKEAAAAVAK